MSREARVFGPRGVGRVVLHADAPLRCEVAATMKASELGMHGKPGCYVCRLDTDTVVEGPLAEEEAQRRASWLEAIAGLPNGFLTVRMVFALPGEITPGG
jgi:hypothetical protein